MGHSWEHFQSVDTQGKRREPQVGSGLFGVHLLIFQYKFNFQIRQIFNILYSPKFKFTFEKEFLSPKLPKNLHGAAKNCRVDVISSRIWAALLEKRTRNQNSQTEL